MPRMLLAAILVGRRASGKAAVPFNGRTVLAYAIGIAGALILRLAVYMKGKNAKKYRHGMEYGSARWSA